VKPGGAIPDLRNAGTNAVAAPRMSRESISGYFYKPMIKKWKS
jgi:hypothetical protein